MALVLCHLRDREDRPLLLYFRLSLTEHSFWGISSLPHWPALHSSQKKPPCSVLNHKCLPRTALSRPGKVCATEPWQQGYLRL